MKRILGQSLSLVALVLLGSVITPACVEDDGSIFVHHALAPPVTRQGGCLYTPDPTTAALSQGLLDTGVRQTYELNLLVANQLIQRGDSLAPRAEANRIHIDGAVVRVTDANGGAISEFTSVTSGFVDAASGNSPGYGIAQVTALDASTVAKLKVIAPDSKPVLVLANVKVFGKTIGGKDVETAEWSFPIRACYGCLVDFSTGDDLAVAGTDCLSSTTTAMASSIAVAQVVPCNSGQDELIACQLCRGLPACNSR